ncbi:ATPase family AAA domain-containing protein 2-like isoform X3 [Pomacea canaliculata]|uniref:ATPase family AAA domain-containing protein 2-like isoform X3 n=1 Tax=Pomacea canaliculata TaxID=400727 RepID=UPI000D739E37|nr:ATPase family AAA domain-containing protein 2-like isoform X3 [Pomacea canaliculata]
MVRTRHNGDTTTDTPPRFLTLDERRSKKSRIHAIDADGNESDHSAIGYHEEHSIFEEKIVESRLRPRVGPRRAYNYVYEDSSDDDTALLISSRRRRARVVNEAPFQMPGSRRRRRHDVCELEHTSEEDGDEDSPHQRRARKLSQVEGDGEDGELCSDMDDDEEEEDLNNCALRRSSRLRQKPYRFRPMAEEITSHGPGDSSNVGGNERGKRQRPSDPPDNPDEEYGDMYSRVKRARNKKTVGHECNNSISNTDGSNDEGDDKQDTEDEAQQRRSYSLREHKPRTQLYIAPAIEGIRKKPKQQSMFRETPPRRLNKHATYRSPAHRNAKFSPCSYRKRETFHGSSTSTSDSSDSGTETTDEQRFNRRKAKSIAKSRNRIMPLNFPNDTVGTSAVMKDRLRAGASSADVDPMEIDTSVNFDSIGGLKQHLMALKEMIVFPLLYPEFYERFKVEPSRGVLFYGPPGTGKTLVARALANECSLGGQRVAFFMRKGADCLSKWVGEAERQLRLLFDKAYEMRPSIIFFDEIDGLAPVRSSRQDQIHNSIVSTLLALMDGLDSRGEIVVIGATNRIDAIDPAFRRPGRFDREFRFPFPNLEDRKKILKIHTRNWKPSLRDEFISELAEKCAGYSGADIKCLVTDATQNALRRHYPQIYTTFEKLQLDVGAITLTARDFARALVNIVPAAQRTVLNPAVALEPSMRPLLQRALCTLSSALAIQFPYARFKRKVELLDLPQAGSSCEEDSQEKLAYQELSSDEEENAPSIFMPHNKNHAFSHKTAASDLSSEPSFIKFSSAMSRFPILYRPRMLVSGESGQGQTVHLAPAALHFMEHLPVYTLCSAAIFAATAKMPEEACANIFYEAQRTAPSIIYMPSINELWAVVSDTLRSTFLSLVHNMQPSTPVLLFATSELPYSLLDEQLKMLFNKAGGQVVEAEVVTSEERNQYFSDLILLHPLRPPPTHKQAEMQVTVPGNLHIFPPIKTGINEVQGCIGRTVSTPSAEVPVSSKQLNLFFGHKNHDSLRVIDYKQDTFRGSCTNVSIERANNAPKYSKPGTSREPDSQKRNNHQPILESAAKSARSPPKQSLTMNQNKILINEHHSGLKLPHTPGSRQQKCLNRKHALPVDYYQGVSKSKLCGVKKMRGSKANHSSGAKQSYHQKRLFFSKVLVSKTRSQQGKSYRGDSLNFNQSASHGVMLSKSQELTSEIEYDIDKASLTCAIPNAVHWPCYKPVNSLKENTYSIASPSLQAAPILPQSRAQCILQVLPKAAPPEPRKLTEREECRLLEQEEDTLRELRIFLRDILSKLGREKKFLIFTKPVDVEDVPDYYDIIKNPMDLSMMMSKIDLHKYSTASAFMDDIYLICSNALEYNPDKGPTDRAIRHRACALRDTAEALLKAELDPDFEKICQEITQSRKRRGVDSSGMVPAFCHTCPLTLSTNDSSTSASKNPSHILQVPEGSRYSRRVRGLDVDNVVPLDLVEKSAQLEKSLLGKTSAMDVDGGETHMYRVGMEHQTQEDSLDTEEEPSSSEKVSSVLSAKPSNSSHTEKNSFKAHCETRPVSSSMIKKMNMRKKCPWLATRRRRRTHSAFSQKDSHSPGSDVDVVSADESEGTVNPCHEQNRQEERVEHIEHEQLPQAPENANNSAVIALKQNSMQSLTRRSNCAGSSSSPAAFGTPVQNHLPSISCTQSHDSCMMQTMQPASTSAANSSEGSNPAASQRPAAAKKLEVDLNAVSTDSGVGSSLDSNGDSRDSIEHNNNNNTGSVTRQETPDHGEENSADKSTAGLACARTRSRTQTAIQQSAFHALEAVMPSIRIDKDRLSQLLEYTVRQTHHCTVEKLLQLYSILSRIIFRHRHQHDKTQLVQEMEEAVETFCGNARLQ